MQETSRYAVGIDIGTTTVRCVVGHIDSTTGTPTIVGVGQSINSGMRKGVVANLTGPAQAIDDALGEAERMSGFQVNAATISINGAHILSTKADGMIAVGGMDHAITEEDLARIDEVATLGKVPANREILEVVPHSYRLDGQDNIKDPLAMTGTRLEINANVISALAPHLANLQTVTGMAKVHSNNIIPAVMAASRAVLSEKQIENGVAVIDLGGTTTSIAIFEEGDLQYVAVIPVGGTNITNDLAIGLKTDPEIAEKVKIAYGSAVSHEKAQAFSVKHENVTHEFSSSDVDEIIGARLEEIFDAVNRELKKAGRAGQLPNGVVLTGGSAKLKGIASYCKDKLGLAVRVGKSSGYGGVVENIEEPQFATAVGLMLADVDGDGRTKPTSSHASVSGKAAMKSAAGFASRLLGRFKA
jgi:cell division protein FtsA